MRHFELQLVGNNGHGISLSDFKVTFDIERNDNKWPAVATVRIYNLSPETQNRIMKRELSQIKVIAGYDGLAPDVAASDVGVVREVSANEQGQVNGTNYSVIFSGDIRFTVTGKDNATDSWVLIQACDSLEAFTKAFINTTLVKGYTASDVYDLLMKTLEPYGISRGIVPKFPPTVYPRGKSFFGMVHTYLDNLAGQCNASWQFNYGKVDMVAKDVAAHEAVVLNADTGLIGMPQQTIGAGVNVRCLINGKIQLHGLIQLDQASVYRTALSGQQVSQAGGVITEENVNGNKVTMGLPQLTNPASVATDGVYIVRYISYTGDTRGQAWYMDLACEARGAADVYSSDSLNKW